MLQIEMIVKILPDAEYGGKFTGYIGKVKNYFSQNKKVGVELFQQTNDASSKGLFWFSESKVVAAGSLPDAMMEYIKADLNATFGVANHIRRSRQTGLPQIKKVIYSGPKTIILWADNTKTIVSCGEADSYDYYLSEFEVFGTRSYANQYEQNYQLQYDYYKAGNTKIANNHTAVTTAVWWGLRSPSYNSGDYFVIVWTDGTYNYTTAINSGGLRPGFAA